ncbi:unnamed protein product, partial [Nesidiocoris tenuis]
MGSAVPRNYGDSSVGGITRRKEVDDGERRDAAGGKLNELTVTGGEKFSVASKIVRIALRKILRNCGAKIHSSFPLENCTQQTKK